MKITYCGLILGLFLILKSVKIRAYDNAKNFADVIVRPTKLWKFLKDDEQTVVQKFRENIDEFSVGNIGCLRCVIKCIV